MWLVPCIEVVLLRGSNHVVLIGGIKFGYLVLSIVARYLIQCPFIGVSSLRDFTEAASLHFMCLYAILT